MIRFWCNGILKNILYGVSCVILSCGVALASPSTDGIQVYQKNVHLSEEHKQRLADDLYRYHNADNLWDELRHEFVLPHYEDNPLVQEQIDWFVHHQDFLMSTATRSAPYLYYILQQAHARHLPPEIVLLPMMESGYNPFAYSPVGAAGIWQMMPGTASGFGIKRNWWYDGRRDVVASTRAALDYLAYLGSFFDGNWLLAIAAYDTGEGNVIAAIRKNIRDGKNTDYWSLPVAEETRIYIPRLLALAIIISHPDMYPIPFPAVRNAPYLAQIDIGGQIDLKHAARLAGLSLRKIMQLNPGYNHTTTDPHGPFKLILPIENVEQFSENLAISPFSQTINWIHYRIRSGDSIASIARRFNVSTKALRKANPKVATNFRVGKRLVIPSKSAAPIAKDEDPIFTSSNESLSSKLQSIPSTPEVSSTKAIANALENFEGKYTLQPGDTLYMVRRGDDIDKIANHFHMTAQAILAINQMDAGSRIRAGDKLIIPTHIAQQNSAPKYQLAPGDTVYMVRRGDNIEKIARRFHTTPSSIRLANLIADNEVHEGDKLIIPTHVG